MVEEWFNGQPLRQILATQKKLEPARAVRIALGVCDALEYMHNHGVVHRDCVPRNILVDAAESHQADRFSRGGERRRAATDVHRTWRKSWERRHTFLREESKGTAETRAATSIRWA